MNEKLLNRVQQDARLNIKQRMAEREHDIVTRLVTAYRANKLDVNQLFGGIASIAELRSIATEAEHDRLLATHEVNSILEGKSNG